MKQHRAALVAFISLAVAGFSFAVHSSTAAQTRTEANSPVNSGAVLVELFTSEGCSSCPPADELLRQVSGHRTSQGQLIVGLSEHVTYWNGLGWKDPFSSQVYTSRQDEYSRHFGLSSVYTPQMVVNGREQFVGGNDRALEAAFSAEAKRKQIALRIMDARLTEKNISFTYSASELPADASLELIAVLVDDMDRSNVGSGENSGRELVHVSVARAFAPLGALSEVEQEPVSLPLPASFKTNSGGGHHLLLFAQQRGGGAIVGLDTKAI